MNYSRYFNNKNSDVESYEKNNDNLGLGHYLQSIVWSVNNKDDALAIYDEAEQLKKQGRIYNHQMEIADDEKKQAISFIDAFNNNKNLPKSIQTATGNIENKYTSKFIELINDFYSQGDIARFIFQTKEVKKNPIPALGFLTDWLVPDEHYKTDGYSDFLTNIGMSDAEFRKYLSDNNAGSVGTKNGIHYLDLNNKNNNILATVSNALLKTKNEDGGDRWGVAMMNYKKDENGNHIIDNNKNFVIDEEPTTRFQNSSNVTSSIMINNEDFVYPNAKINPFNVLLPHAVDNESFKRIGMLVESANLAKNEVFGNIDEEKTLYQIQDTGIKASVLNRIQKDYEAGKLKDGKYKNLINYYTKYYNDIIGTTPYTKYKVYSNKNNEEGDKVLKELNQKEKANLQEWISAAYKEGKLNYSIAQVGDETGMRIVIPATVVKTKKNLNYFKNIRGEEVDTNNEIEVFVPDLCKKSVDAVLNNDTRVQASKEIYSMRRYGYDYELTDGSKLKAYPDGSFEKINDTGSNSVISQNEAIRDINKDKIINVGSKLLLSSVFNYKGRLTRLTINNNGELNAEITPEIIKQLKQFLNNAVVDIYPDLLNETDKQKIINTLDYEGFCLINKMLKRIGFSTIDISYYKSVDNENN